MISYKMEDVVETTIEDGIWLDFLEQTWIFFIKDSIWVDEEIQTFKKKKLHLSYFQKGIVDGFLIDVNDVIETSDVPFCILDVTKDFLNTLKDNQNYNALFLLIDGSNKIRARKEGAMSFEVSSVIKHCLREQRMNDYDEKAFNIALTKMQKRYEPYELEEFIKTSQDF
ncbi:hypothetical protein [Anaerorhabdus furcosa]|uniref:Uncharacterized protein n=1 Tax=Anaerorhabdus furcosa TaxID=118967 RepID=A0A1T4QDU4_9FIRM|nr:hypothetical protein [Anaerorhabdus furcosa]SKA01786.1 hypothetical protein SAMN02745191_2422 [Anaerorhabdus furcosa]